MKINKKITFISLLITVIMLISMTGINQIENKTLDSGNIYLFNRNKNNHFMDLSRNIRTKKKENQKLLSNDKLTSYTPHSPIEVTSNNDFSKLGFPGSGTKNDPYLIEGYSFSDTSFYPIYITGTDAYFIFKNNYVTSGPYNDAIYLLKVKNGEFLNNSIINCYNGIDLSQSTNNTFSGNLIENYQLEGMSVYLANNTIISYNNFTNSNDYVISLGLSGSNNLATHNYINNNFGMSAFGIDLGGTNNSITYNMITRTERGIYSEYKGRNNLIESNIIFNVQYSGIQLFRNCNNYTISLNIVNKSTEFGISVFSSSNNTISSNIIQNSKSYGITFYTYPKDSAPMNNIVEYNNYLNNNLGKSQASQDGGNNTFQYNYWNDWTTPDKNNDNLVDNPYQIDGAAKNVDPYPIASLREFTSPVVDHPPNISFNKGSKGNTITWTAKDQNPNLYSVNINGTSFLKDKSWSNGTISVNVDELSLGLHIVTITIYDRSWNFITDSVNVTVFASTKNGFLPFPISLISFVSVYFILIYTKHNFDKKKAKLNRN